MGVSFDGQSSPTRFLVIDVRNDPLGTPNAYLGADPIRPFVSIGLPHGVRRFEFMIFDQETDEQVADPLFVHQLLARHVPDPEFGGRGDPVGVVDVAEQGVREVDVLRARTGTAPARSSASTNGWMNPFRRDHP